MMKYALLIVSMAIIVSVEAGTISPPENEVEYFSNTLKSVQGAIEDTIRAGMDLELMEGSLQRIVDASSYFYRTESAIEYAVASDAYENGESGGKK